MSVRPLVVTGIRVIDLFAPFPRGGSIAVYGDLGSGINVVAMEVMHNLCQRYEAKASCQVTVDGSFSESNVRGWVEKLGVGPLIATIELADSPSVVIDGGGGRVATVLPFVEDTGADAWVVIRRTVLATGRLPGVELHESGSRHLSEEASELATRIAAEVDGGNEEVTKFLAQPFFLAEAFSSVPGEMTEREEALVRVRELLKSTSSLS